MNMLLCMIHIAFFSFCFGFNKFLFCKKPLYWEGHTGSIKLKDFCHLALRYRFQIQGQFLNIRNAVNSLEFLNETRVFQICALNCIVRTWKELLPLRCSQEYR